MAFTPRIVFVTSPNIEEARALAHGILEKKLAACVNIVPGVESHYWWEGKLDQAAEVQLIIKTSAEKFEALAEVIRWHHSYKCPEIVALSPHEISPEYHAWWEEQVSAGE